MSSRRPSPTHGPSALAVALTLLVAPPAGAQNTGEGPSTALRDGLQAPTASGVIDLHRVSGPLVLDGVPDEAAWAAVAPLPLTMYEPSFRGASDRRIELRVAYDDDALWVAAWFHHDDASAIRAFSLTRDRWSGDDGFGVLVDTFNDNENALRFVGLPLGTRMDMSITGDGQSDDGGSGGGPRGMSWNTFWDLETRIGDDGWTGEMRIPFSSLRFETGPDGSVVMGLMAYAYEPVEGNRWTFPAIPPTSPYTQVSAFQDVRLRGVTERNPVYVTPYALTGRARATTLEPGAIAWDDRVEGSREVGLDLKINPTPNLTLDLTLNTDFAAVEADQQQVNLTRFSLFFDEKRPFFQERAGIFAFETGADRGTLFYSRRIGLVDGAPVPILGGARLVGRLGSWDLGLIAMQTGDEGEVDGERFGVLRLRRGVLNDHSFLGGMATGRVAPGGRYNVTYGLDTQLRVGGDEYLTLKWLQTLQGGEDAAAPLPTGVDAGRFVLDWTRRRLQGFSYQHVLVWSGPAYDPGVGFEARSDFALGRSDWNYQWFPDERSRWRRVWLGLASSAWRRNADGEVESAELEPFLTLETKPGHQLKVSAKATHEDVPEPFALSEDAAIPAGSYAALEGSVELQASRGGSIRPSLTLTGGEFFDGSRFGTDARLTWIANRHLDFTVSWDWNRIRFDARDQRFDAHLLRLQARGALNTRASMDTFVQYNSLTDQVSTNARFRYNFREGQDLWLVWNEGLWVGPELLGVPRRPRSEARTLTVKYTHTLVF